MKIKLPSGLLMVTVLIVSSVVGSESEDRMQKLLSEALSCMSSAKMDSLMKDLGVPDFSNTLVEQLDELQGLIEEHDITQKDLDDFEKIFEDPPAKGIVTLCELLGYPISLTQNTDDPERSEMDLEQKLIDANKLLNELLGSETSTSNETETKDQLFGRPDAEIKAEIKKLNQDRYGDAGASVVKYAVDEDWKAYQDLKKSKYKPHRDLIKKTKDKYKDVGWSVIKYAVDEDIEAQKELDDF